jgi:hypothetical protein
MKRKWHLAEFTLVDRGHDREGTASVYLKYDLACWTFGFRFEHDPCWYDFHIDLGPIELSICYWRTFVAVIE